MGRLTKTDAIASLGTAPIVATDDQGRSLELTPLSATGTRLTALSDRLRVSSASHLTVRVHGDDGRPWLLGLKVDSAELHNQELARVTLRAATLRLDRQHRQADRTSLRGQARLTAINCQNVVDGDVVEGLILDAGEGGAALLTQRLLRRGDRLRLTARFFAMEIVAEVRVARIVERGDQVEVGCRFIAIAPAERRKLRELMHYRPPEHDQQPGTSFLRDLATAGWDGEEPGPRWRRVFRRSA